MTRIARVIITSLPIHVTQRGNRSKTVFLGDDDYALYIAIGWRKNDTGSAFGFRPIA